MQTGADIIAKISEPVRQQIYGNTTNKIFLRVLDFAQAKELVEGLGQCQIPKITCMRSVSANQNIDQIGKLFTSGYTERLDMMEVKLLPPEILMALPKGQAVLVTEGNPPFKLRIPLLDKDASIEKESYFGRLISKYEKTTVISVPTPHVGPHDQGKEEYETNA